jgi:hypothetical protein
MVTITITITTGSLFKSSAAGPAAVCCGLTLDTRLSDHGYTLTGGLCQARNLELDLPVQALHLVDAL